VSKTHHPPIVVEWSPGHSTVFDPAENRSKSASTLAEAAAGHAGRDVVVGISRRTVFVRAVRVPDASKEDVRRALRLTLGQHFPVPASEMSFDLRFTSDTTVEGRLGIVSAIRSEELRQLNAELRAAGLRARVILPAAFGSWLLAQSVKQPECAVVSKTSEGIAIDIVAGDELRHSRVLPPGIAPESLRGEVERTIASAGMESAAIVAAGGLALDGADVQTAVSPLASLVSGDRAHVHLEVDEEVQLRQTRRVGSRVRVAAVLWIATLGLAGYAYVDRAAAAKTLQAHKADNAKSLRDLRSRKSTEDARLATAQKLESNLTQAFLPAQRVSDVLSTAGNGTPGTVWLTGLSLERGKPMMLRGTAMNNDAVAEYLHTLSTQPRFRDVKLVFANNGLIDQTPVVQFSITGFPVGNVPTVEQSRGGAR
jgi:Tfp pilus assembly protein PilN